MPQEFFTTNPRLITRRLDRVFDNAVDENGQPLFPDHSTPGSAGYTLKQFMVAESLHWHREADSQYRSMSPITASGQDLDAWAQFFGEPRGAVRYATGQVRITASVPGQDLERLLDTRQLPQGMTLTHGGNRFRLTGSTSIPPDGRTATVQVQAEVAGPGIRVPVGAVMEVDGGRLASELTASAQTAIDGGRQKEPDDQLRFRLSQALRDPTSYDGFRAKMLTHPDVANAELQQNAYGPGTLEAFVTPTTSLPRQGLRDELESLWSGVGSAYVAFPDYEALQMKIRVGPGGPSPELVSNYLINLDIGQTVVLNEIETRLQNAGASDAQVIGIKRGIVTPSGEMTGSRQLEQITNLTARTPRTKWYSRPDWITLCR